MSKKKTNNLLLEPAKKQNAYLKMGILGFTGSGKSYTATLIAIGLYKLIKSKKPICFLDTEGGLDYLIKYFDNAKIPIITDNTRSRSYSKMLKVIDEAEQICDIMIIDSISAIWNDFMESFKRSVNRDRIYVWDWNVLKPKWNNEFAIPRYINNKLHLIVCGRAGYVYESEPNDRGKMETHAVGTKMKVEAEFGYEPSLLVEMEQREEEKDGKRKIIHQAFIKKDRTTFLDGKYIDNPTFEDMLPFINDLTLDGKQGSVGKIGESEDAFDDSFDTKYQKTQKEKREREIYLDKIKEELSTNIPGQSASDKKRKKKLLEKMFGTKSWVELTEREKLYSSEILKRGFEELKKEFNIDDALFDEEGNPVKGKK